MTMAVSLFYESAMPSQSRIAADPFDNQRALYAKTPILHYVVDEVASEVRLVPDSVSHTHAQKWG